MVAEKESRFTQKMRSERLDWNVGLNARFQTLTEKLVKAIACGSRGVVQSEVGSEKPICCGF